MLTETEYQQWKKQIGASEEAAAMIDLIRRSEPVRRVGNRAGNVSVRYPSRKMGRVIQAESHRVEFAAVQWMEYDDDVLEYYDQPNKLELLYSSRVHKRVRVPHTPDFFVLRRNRAGWEEWKPEEKLHELANRMPNRYERDGDGVWRCKPGEVAAQKLGLEYCVRTSAEINWVFQRNIQFLDDYLRSDEGPADSEEVGSLLKEMLKRGNKTLEQIFERLDFKQRDSAYWLIATSFVHTDLSAAALTNPDKVRIFLTKRQQQLHAARQTFERNETKATEIQAMTQVNLYGDASPEALADATNRYRIIEPWLRGEVSARYVGEAAGVTQRTLSRWRADYLEAKGQYGDGLVGLLSYKNRRGNRGLKVDQRVQELMQYYVTKVYETPKQRTARLAYGLFVSECQKQNLEAPSYVTFMSAIKMRPRHEQALKRTGRRAAYAQAPSYWELSLTTPRHGDRPFEIVHLDHTELDIELVCSQTQKVLGRPWATFMVDAYSRRLLAVIVTYDNPSYRSCMAALRECVRRFGRLPQMMVVDGGADFRSVYFETILARYECIKKTRPSAQPRFGSVCERLFGTTHSMFIHNLQGNTQITRNVRQVTKQVDPKRHAVWTLGELQQVLCEWAYDIYDTLEHPVLGATPRATFERGLDENGQREFRKIAYDEDFLMATMPTTVRGVAMLRSDKGVQINGIRYWSDAFRDARLHRTWAPVRYDPSDISIGFVCLEGRWVRCRSDHAIQLAGYSERAIGLISEELRKRQRSSGQRYQVTTARLAQFIEQAETTEALLAQRLKDAAQQEVRKMTDKKLGASSEVGTSQQHLHKATRPPTPRLALTKAKREKLVVYEEY